MELFHTSPNEIKEINGAGRFGEFLFFSYEPYKMSAGDVITYKIEIGKEEIISAGRLFYHDDAEKLDSLVAELASKLGCDTETAESLIEETADIYDLADELGIEREDIGEISWDIQHFTARAAKALGYRGAIVSDELGSSVMIDMAGHESELIKV